MRDKTIKLITHPLFSGSAVMVVGSNVINALNYIYHFAMGRLLGVSAYGELVALFSFISILSMVPMSFSMVITKFVSGSSSKESIQGFLYVFYKYMSIVTLTLSIILLLFSGIITSFLHIESIWLIVGSIFIFVISLPLMINRSTLQGLIKFNALLVTLFSENIFKLFLGLLLVLLGYSVGGALTGIFVGTLFSYFVSYYYLKEYPIQKKFKPDSIKPVVIYSIPVFVNFIAVTLFSNSDLLLVKHYFSAGQVGTYAAAAVLSKVILFGVAPIVAVMFPIISKRHAAGDSYKSIFMLTIAAVSFFCLIAIFGYTFLSGTVIWILYGTTYLAAGSLLSLFSIYVSLFSLSTVFTNYFLAIGDTRAVYLFLGGAILQIFGIVFFHQSLEQVLFVSISISALLLGLLIVYSVYENGKLTSEAFVRNSAGVQTTKINRKRSKKN
jgi:O-antigen/teichoic acid export membrane protein